MKPKMFLNRASTQTDVNKMLKTNSRHKTNGCHKTVAQIYKHSENTKNITSCWRITGI